MLDAFFRGFKVPVKLFWEPSYDVIIETQRTLSDMHVQYWLHYSFPRWTWWFLLFWTIFPLIVWWRYTNRQRFTEISFFGMMVSISAGILDSIGVFTMLWTYPYGLVPALPNFFPIDYVAIPVFFMLIYQKYPRWKGFLIACTLGSSVLSLVLDPVIVWLNLYQPLTWHYLYSVPVFVFLASFCKLITNSVVGQDAKYSGISIGKAADGR